MSMEIAKAVIKSILSSIALSILLGIGSLSGAEEGKASGNITTDVSNAQDNNSSTTSTIKSPKRFFDVFYGTVKATDANVSGSFQPDCFLFCPPPTYFSQQEHFGTSSVYGVRIGKWFETYPFLGLAADISYLSADATNASVWYVPISFEFLARYSLFRAESLPDGRLQLYGGFMLSLVVGDVRVNGMEGSLTTNFGYGALLGIAWHFPSFAIFSEYRVMQVSLSYDYQGLFGGTQSASVDLNPEQMVFGFSYKY
jgi:hypothetical protein